jgi:hypothetical protein
MLKIAAEVTHYDILDLEPHASQVDIRQAYLRAKTTYSKDNPALYAIFSLEERADTLARIEEAYQTLSNPEARKRYDLKHGASLNTSLSTKSLPSIDRVPPMDNTELVDMLLIPPTTDFEEHPTLSRETPKGNRDRFVLEPTPPVAVLEANSNLAVTNALPHRNLIPRVFRLSSEIRTELSSLPPELLARLQVEETWDGLFLKEIREAFQISLEEMMDITKINKNYLERLEEEAFDQLPASVYIRGFLTQIAKVLKLPATSVSQAYMRRVKAIRKE